MRVIRWWSGEEWSGVEWSGVEWSGVEWSGVECKWCDSGGGGGYLEGMLGEEEREWTLLCCNVCTHVQCT